MARLYLARRRGVGGFSRLVTLKLVHPHLTEDEKIVKLFLDEARISAHVAHPNVVHVEEVGKIDGSYFIAMEYVHGVSLAELLTRLTDRRLRLRPKLCVWLAAQIAEALHAAHEARSENGTPLGIVHRDVSPQNVLISHTGHVKLIDFGIARDQAEDPQGGHAVLGKLRYMSPEQLRLEQADRRTDVYALGIMLWEMLSGRNLLRCQRLDDDNDWSIRENPPPPSKYSGHSTPSLDRVVLNAIAYDPNERYDSAFQFRSALLRADPEAVTLDAPMVAALMRSMFGDELDSRRASWPTEVAGELEPKQDETSRKWSLEELTAENVGMMPMLDLEEFAREQQAQAAAEARERAASHDEDEGAAHEADAPDDITHAGADDGAPDDADPTIAIRGGRSQPEAAAGSMSMLPSEHADWLLAAAPSARRAEPAIASVRADLMLALASASVSYDPREGLRLSAAGRRASDASRFRPLSRFASLRLGLAGLKMSGEREPEPQARTVIDMPETTGATVVVADAAIDTFNCPPIPVQIVEAPPSALAFRATTLGSACLVVGVFLGTLLSRSPAPAAAPVTEPGFTTMPRRAAAAHVEALAAEATFVTLAPPARRAPAEQPPQPSAASATSLTPVAGCSVPGTRVLTGTFRDPLEAYAIAANCTRNAELEAARVRAAARREARVLARTRNAWRAGRHPMWSASSAKRFTSPKAK
jgi:serine/threonine-protein kinase